MSLIFSKRIVMTNPYLVRLYYVSVIWFLLMIIGNFVYSEKWKGRHSMQDRIHVSVWHEGSIREDAIAMSRKHASERMQVSPLCTDSRQFDYWFNKEFQFSNFSCLPACQSGQREGCMPYHYAAIREQQDQVLVVSSLSRVTPRRDEDVFDNYVISTVATERIAFAYGYDWPKPKERAVFSFWDDEDDNDDTVESEFETSRGDVTTVILDANGKVWETYEPSNSKHISLSMEELIHLSGLPSDFMDTPQANLGRNQLDGAAHPEGPLPRISGLDLSLKIACTPQAHEGNPLRPSRFNFGGPYCVVRIRYARSWAGRTDVEEVYDPVENAHTSRIRMVQGIRVKAVTEGSYATTDFNNILLNFTAAIVLLAYPKKFVLFVATTMLGHLSKIYRKVIFERFNIGDQIGGVAARLMSHSASFVDLEETDEQRGIGKDRLEERIRDLTKYRQIDCPTIARLGRGHTDELVKIGKARKKEALDDSEVEAFANFAFKACVDSSWINSFGDYQRLRKGVEESACGFMCRPIKPVFKLLDRMSELFFDSDLGLEQDDHEENGNRRVKRLNVDMFMTACSNSETVGFAELVKLFNARRKMGCLEKMFMPKYLYQCIEMLRFNQEVKGESEDCEPDDSQAMAEDTDLMRLRINIISAEHLKNTDTLGMSDPYCTVEQAWQCKCGNLLLEETNFCGKCGESHFKKDSSQDLASQGTSSPSGKKKHHPKATTVIPNNLNPVWDQDIIMHDYHEGRQLIFKVWDKDIGKHDDFLGSAVLEADRISPACTIPGSSIITLPLEGCPRGSSLTVEVIEMGRNLACAVHDKLTINTKRAVMEGLVHTVQMLEEDVRRQADEVLQAREATVNLSYQLEGVSAAFLQSANNEVTKAGFEERMKSSGFHSSTQRLDEVFDGADTNGDGVVNMKDVSNYTRRRSSQEAVDGTPKLEKEDFEIVTTGVQTLHRRTPLQL